MPCCGSQTTLQEPKDVIGDVAELTVQQCFPQCLIGLLWGGHRGFPGLQHLVCRISDVMAMVPTDGTDGMPLDSQAQAQSSYVQLVSDSHCHLQDFSVSQETNTSPLVTEQRMAPTSSIVKLLS